KLMNHDPKAATQRKKATFAGDLHLLRKLRGKDLNLRPLGYEGKVNAHRNQRKPTKPNSNTGFSRLVLGWFCFLLAGVRAQNMNSRCSHCASFSLSCSSRQNQRANVC